MPWLGRPRRPWNDALAGVIIGVRPCAAGRISICEQWFANGPGGPSAVGRLDRRSATCGTGRQVMRRWRLVEWMVVAAAVAVGRPAWGEGTGSKFLPGPLMARARRNIAEHAWAAEARDRLVKAAEPWLAFSDDELWNLMFGNTIKRSWMVWSNGHCPACGKSVPMYNWEMAALARPWKVRCPHCKALNDETDKFCGQCGKEL